MNTCTPISPKNSIRYAEYLQKVQRTGTNEGLGCGARHLHNHFWAILPTSPRYAAIGTSLISNLTK